ncbi:MAG: epimerase [Rhodobacteraceae bacterium]|nr:epimerase [Paracoccaceae bacterium]
MKNKVLVLGASGSFGQNAVVTFENAGWQVRKYQRGQEDMATAAKGVDVIVNSLNPKNYKGWVHVLPQIAREVVAAAKVSGATIVQPGNVYNFGAAPGVWSADTPHAATTKKGRARIEMERILREASKKDGLQVIILRAGDFIDSRPSGNFIDFMVGKLGKGRFIYPGKPDIPHAWAYLPDMARAAVALAEKRGALSDFEDVPFSGHTFTGEGLRAGLAKIMDKKLKLVRFPWLLMKGLSPVWGLAREMQEIRYLWDTPHSLSSARLQQILPDFEKTPAEDVFRQLANPSLPLMA